MPAGFLQQTSSPFDYMKTFGLNHSQLECGSLPTNNYKVQELLCFSYTFLAYMPLNEILIFY